MPVCPNCNVDISDKAWKIHPFMCKVKTAKPIISPPPTVTPATPAPVPATTPEPAKPEVVVVEAVPVEPTPTIAAPVPAPTVEVVNGSIEIVYPTPDPYFMVAQNVANTLKYADAISHDEPTNLLVTGHAGCGKTSLASQFAALRHSPMVVADFGVIQEPQQLFLTTHLTKGEGDYNITDTRESAFVRGIETPNCVVVMDELNRVENERCLNPLMPILDGRKVAWIDELRRFVKVAPGVVFIATINEGSLFCGTETLDGALRDRFGEVFLDYLPADYEKQVLQRKINIPEPIARSLAEFAFVVRTTPAIEKKVSTRQMLRSAKYWTKGAPLWHAVELSIGNYNDPEWRQQVLEVFSLNIKDADEYTKWMNKGDSEGKYAFLV